MSDDLRRIINEQFLENGYMRTIFLGLFDKIEALEKQVATVGGWQCPVCRRCLGPQVIECLHYQGERVRL